MTTKYLPILFGLLLLSGVANGKGLSKGEFDNHAFFTQEYAGGLQECGARYSPEYTRLAETLDERFFTLLEVANLRLTDPALHYRKIAIVRGIERLSQEGPENLKHCDVIRSSAERQITSLDDDISKLKALARQSKANTSR